MQKLSEEKLFDSYKKIMNENVFKLAQIMENFKKTEDDIKSDFKKEQISLPEKFIKRMETTKVLYNSMDLIISQISSDFNSLNKYMKGLGDIFGKPNKRAKETEYLIIFPYIIQSKINFLKKI